MRKVQESSKIICQEQKEAVGEAEHYFIKNAHIAKRKKRFTIQRDTIQPDTYLDAHTAKEGFNQTH